MPQGNVYGLLRGQLHQGFRCLSARAVARQAQRDGKAFLWSKGDRLQCVQKLHHSLPQSARLEDHSPTDCFFNKIS